MRNYMHENIFVNLESVFDEITNENLDNITFDFTLRDENYQVFYIVDTFDIIEYCFPAVFSKVSNTNSKKLSSFYLAYQYLFSNVNIKPIILDEYKIELFTNWNKLKSKINEYQHNNLKEFLSSQYNAIKEKQKKIEFIEEHISTILSLAYGIFRDINPIHQFNSLIKDGLQIDRFICNDKDDQIVIRDIFAKTKFNTRRVNRIFDKFCKKIAIRIENLDKNKKFIYLENSYRDIQVFDRIINLNHEIKKNIKLEKLKQKYIFLFFSSTPTKSKLIKDLYSKTIKLEDGINVNLLHRSNFDTYLYNLLNIDTYFGNDKNIILSFIDILRKSISCSNKVLQIKNDINPELLNQLEIEIINSRKRIEDRFLDYKIFVGHLESFRNAIKLSKNKGDLSILNKLFEDTLENFNSKEDKYFLEEIKNTMDKYTDNFQHQVTIVNFIDKKQKIQIFPGMDEVRSLVQSYPILLFYNCKYENIKEIQEVFLEIISPNYFKLGNIEKFIKISIPSLKKLDYFVHIVYDQFVKLLTPTDTEERKREIELNIIENLEELIIINSKSKLERYKSEENDSKFRRQIFRPDKAQLNTLLYFQTWVLRRNNEFIDAINIINEHFKTDKTDTRLYHSRALCYKSKYYCLSDKSPITSTCIELERCLELSFKDFSVCKEKYSKQLSEISENTTSIELIKSVLIAIDNSICDTFIRLFEIDNNKYEFRISDGRKLINSVKEAIGSEYTKYSAYNHTEVDLEISEAIIAYTKGDFISFGKKRDEAIKRFTLLNEDKLLEGLKSLSRTKENLSKLKNR